MSKSWFVVPGLFVACSAAPPSATHTAAHGSVTAPSASASVAAAPEPPPAKRAPGFDLPAVFGDHMLLQRDRANALWGWDEPGHTVTVTLDGKSSSAQAGPDGRWQLALPALPAGGPHTITVKGSEERRLNDVLVGEVWLASGQSNMEFELERASDAVKAVGEAGKPELRLFTVQRRTAGEPQSNVEGAWQVSTPRSAARFSAVAYFFAEKLHQTLKVPVGVIHASWGGTPAEAWTSRAALAARAETKPLAELYTTTTSAEANAEYERKKAAWHDQVYCKDPGNQGFARHYADRDFDDTSWKELKVPGLWQDQGLAINGAVWFRRAFEISAQEAKLDFELELGAIDDFDETYVNGVKVGGIGPEHSSAWNTPRSYRVPSSALHAGKNVIAVRVFDHYGFGGLHGLSTAFRLFPSGRQQAARPLAGAWRTFVEWSVPFPKDLLGKEPQAPMGPNNPHAPGVLFDGMIAPLVPYGARGVIWYQGESNVGRAEQYRALLPALIGDWRSRFGRDLAFYIVQLANFLPKSAEPRESAWAELRDAQAKTAASVGGSGLAVAIDIGDAADIHPTNKRDVGHRLALIALANTYRKPIEYSGPVVDQVRAEAGRLRVTFRHAEGGLLLADAVARHKERKVLGFAIAAADKRFVWADAKLDGQSVVLSSPAVREPRWVRYGWADNPDVNLTNRARLPAVPFQAEAR